MAANRSTPGGLALDPGVPRTDENPIEIEFCAIANFVDHLGEIAIDAQELAVIAKMAQREFMAEAAFRS